MGTLDSVKLEYEDIPPAKIRVKTGKAAKHVMGKIDIPQGKPKKVLTNPKRRSIVDSVKQLIKRKDDTMASTNKTKSTEVAPTKGRKAQAMGTIMSLAWLLEASFRGFVGWVLLTNFSNYATTAAAFYALGTAAIIVLMHFVRANRG